MVFLSRWSLLFDCFDDPLNCQLGAFRNGLDRGVRESLFPASGSSASSADEIRALEAAARIPEEVAVIHPLSMSWF